MQKTEDWFQQAGQEASEVFLECIIEQKKPIVRLVDGVCTPFI